MKLLIIVLKQIISLKISSYKISSTCSCTLKEEDLVDDLRILKIIGAHFYPCRLTDISPPDIYGIVIDKERGYEPHIASQEEVINEAVRLTI